MAFPEVYISKIKEENFVDGGNVQLEWNDTVNTPLAVGTVCPIDSDYILFSKYYPNQVSAYEYRYTPRFLHKLAQTNYLPFYFKTRAVGEQSDIILATYPYTGNISTVANALAECLTDHGDLGQWTADTSGLSNSIIKSVNFDGATIKSAAAAIADAFGVDYYFIWSTHTIKFGSYAAASSPDYGTNQTAENGTENIGSLVSATDGGIQYNVFRILGGTKNMSKKTISGQNVQVTQRLMLAGDSIIDTRPAGSTLPKIMKDLVFDDIYPKMELWMYDVHERRCYLQDENGKKIIDTTYLNPETGAEEHTYKQYSKWYFKLARWNGSELVPYIFDTNLQIQNMPLAMLFQPNYNDNALPQPLVGREYELVYFSSVNPELELDDFDVNPSGYQPIHGEFRIIFKVEGNMILPSTSESGIRPYGGSMSLANNKVTLINVEVDLAYEATAKAELQEAANAAIAIETRDKSSQTYVTYGEGPQLGGIAGSGGTVTNIRKDLISGEVQYTVGDYNSSKGLISRLSDKIETISTSGSGTTKQDDPTSGRDGGISELAIPILARMMGSGNVVKDTLTILKELILGTNGQGIFIDHNGDSNATIGSLTVLGATHLNEIDVNHIRHTGGMMVVTKANLIVDSYEVLDGGAWNLYFRRRDGNGQTIYNLFQVGDFALMMTFNEDLSGGISRYFWRQVVGSGIKTETVVDEETGETSTVETDLAYITVNYGSYSSVPKEGDVVVQLGNVSVEERQGATVFGGSGANGGFFAIYQGFKSIGNSAPNLDNYNNALIYLSPKKNKISGDFISIAGDNLEEQLAAIRGDLLSIRQQSDKQLVIWYGDDDAPLPNSSDTTHWNSPAKDWHDADVLAGNTDQQTLHLEDIFYLRRNNTTRTGGRAWQWTYDSELGIFLWVEITDADTIAALEAADDAVQTANDAKTKVENFGDDGRISAGTEKSELLIMWQDTVAEYIKLIEQAEDYDLDDVADSGEGVNIVRTPFHDYEDKYELLAIMLNGGSTTNINSIKAGSMLPAWLQSLNVDSVLSDYNLTASQYRSTWQGYFDARSTLLKAIEAAAKSETDRAHGRIDDIASDGIISAGTEKSLLYIDWLKAVAEYKKYTEQAEDYFGENNAQDNDLVTAYTALATMLNNGTAPTANILNGVDRPAWLTAANMNVDTVLSETPTLTAANYHSVWNAYQSALNALLKAITAKAKELADAAQADATNALNQISDMGNDGKLDPSEKLTVKREFVAAYHEMMDDGSNGSSSGILDMAKDDSNNWIIDNATWIAPYIAAFRALGTYLNGGTSWTEPALSSFSDSALPSWIQDANMGNTQNITGSTWRGLWSEFYSRRTAVLTALTDNAQDTADTANNRLNDIADDGKLDPTEKMVVRREFVAAWRERDAQGGLIDRCYDSNNNPLNSTIVSSYLNPYKNAFLAVANYLNGSNGTWTDTAYPTLNIDDYIPLWLHIARKDTTETINGETWRSLWSAFYTARTALLTALSDDAKDRADDAQDTANQKKRVFSTNANTLPPAPYDPGDLWVNAVWNSQGASWRSTDPTWSGDTLVCVTGRSSDSNRDILDWADAASGTTAKIQNLGNAIELEVRNRKEGTSTSLHLDDTTGGLYVNKYDPNTNTWTQVGLIELCLVKGTGSNVYSKLNLKASNTEINSDLISVIASNITIRADHLSFVGDNSSTLKIAAGNIDFTGTNFTIDAARINFSGKTISLTANTTLSFSGGTIDFTGTNVNMNAENISFTATDGQKMSNALGFVMKKGHSSSALGIGVYKYNSGTDSYDWVESLSFSISNGVTKLVLTADTSTINADALVLNGKTVSISSSKKFTVSSAGTLSLEGGTIDIKGSATVNVASGSTMTLASGSTMNLTAATVNMNASQLNFDGENVTIAAGQTLTFTGGTGSGQTQGTIDFTGAKINMNADQLTFAGRTIALGTSQSKVTINGGDIQVASNKTLSFSSGSIDFTGATVTMSGANISFSATNSFKAAVGNSGVVLSENLISAFIDGITTNEGKSLANKLGIIMKTGYSGNDFGFGWYTYNSVNDSYEWNGGLNFNVGNDGYTRLVLSADNAKIYADTLVLDGKTVNISASKTFTVSSSGELSLSGGTIEIEGSAGVTIKSGSSLTLNSGSTLTIKGASLEISANSTLTINSGKKLTFSSGGSGNTKGTIDFTGAKISMYAEQIDFCSGNFVISDGTYDNFKVTSGGAVSIRGTVTATAGYIGGTNGWTIESQKMHSGTIGTSESMFLATTDMTATINGASRTTLRFAIGSKFGVLKDGSLIASNVEISGAVTATSGSFNGTLSIPADDGTFTYAKNNVFGLYMDSGTAFTSGRADYLYGYTQRGAILRIEQITATSSFRGIYGNCEVEIQGITQLLRTPSKINDETVFALIVEGIDNKKMTKTVGIKNSGRRIVNVKEVSNTSYSVGDSDEKIVFTRSGDQSVTLPSSPEDGREIWMRNKNGGTVSVSASHTMVGDNPSGFTAVEFWHIYTFYNGTWYYGYTQ